jgi:IS5 family transposase
MGQRSFFDAENRLQSVSKMGDPLERLAAVIPCESFRPLLMQVHEKERKSNAGRKPLDVVLMSKVPIQRNSREENCRIQADDVSAQ